MVFAEVELPGPIDNTTYYIETVTDNFQFNVKSAVSVLIPDCVVKQFKPKVYCSVLGCSKSQSYDIRCLELFP